MAMSKVRRLANKLDRAEQYLFDHYDECSVDEARYILSACKLSMLGMVRGICSPLEMVRIWHEEETPCGCDGESICSQHSSSGKSEVKQGRCF